VTAPGHTLSVPDLANPTQFSFADGSFEIAPPLGCFIIQFTGTGYPAIPLVDLDTLGFQTPFGLL
jgi:hypothetical protein